MPSLFFFFFDFSSTYGCSYVHGDGIVNQDQPCCQSLVVSFLWTSESNWMAAWNFSSFFFADFSGELS